jgi:hypothetical protein
MRDRRQKTEDTEDGRQNLDSELRTPNPKLRTPNPQPQTPNPKNPTPNYPNPKVYTEYGIQKAEQ